MHTSESASVMPVGYTVSGAHSDPDFDAGPVRYADGCVIAESDGKSYFIPNGITCFAEPVFSPEHRPAPDL